MANNANNNANNNNNNNNDDDGGGWVVKFTPFSSSVDSPFWVKYCEAKLETIQLNEEPIDIVGSYAVDGAPRLLCQQSSHQPHAPLPNERVRIPIQLIGYNTIESFQKVDKNKILVQSMRQKFVDGNVESLVSAVLLTFADLKNHRVLYWFGIPALLPKSSSPIRCTQQLALSAAWTNEEMAALSNRLQQMRKDDASAGGGLKAFFVTTKDSTVPLQLSCIDDLKVEKDSDLADVMFGFFDPAGDSGAMDATQKTVGWPMRNLVAYLSIHLDLGGKTVRILSYRPANMRRMNVAEGDGDGALDDLKAGDSAVMHVVIPTKAAYDWSAAADASSSTSSSSEATSTTADYKAAGWELNQRKKPGPRWVNLRPLLDATHLAIQAADLNLKLMKWRMLPNLNVELLNSTKVLMIGAGTLGCNVARTLLGWGVRKVKIVDYGHVSYSNPVRQPLFTLEDCQGPGGRGKPKAQAAAEHLRLIAADVESEGIMLSIPMPGHPEPAESIQKSVSALDALVQEADVVFLLTDTRESRWLPTVMTAAHDKTLINAALGLDSWLVMRHGGGFGNGDTAPEEVNRLGCYYCNDIVAPEDSTKNRTLDQQCTVTRPGLAPIASSMAVELMVALLHHPLRHFADAPKTGSGDFSPSTSDASAGALGVMPHQVRGSLVSYTMMTPKVPAFRCCTACSSSVVDAYKANKMEFVQNVCKSMDGAYLEDMAGLTQFRLDAAKKLEEMEEADWDDDEGEGDW